MQDELISRQAAIDAVNDVIADYVPNLFGRYEALPLEMASAINRLPSVNPQHTEAEIQKMQELEQAEIQKAYELGKTEGQKSKDAVSRQVVLEVLKDKWNAFFDANDAMQESIDTIEALLPVNPQGTGHWIAIDEEPHEDYECDKCGYVCSTFTANIAPYEEYKYCPSCGVKMFEPQESEVKE